MVNNSTKINKTKENLSNDSQQFLQNEQSLILVELLTITAKNFFVLLILEELLTITV
jgi:hypothetical protein